MTLRIQRSAERGQVVFTLTGRIQADQVSSLIGLLKDESSAQGLLLDLDQVKLVDRDAVLFLALSEARGIKPRNCPSFIREWINRERNPHRNGGEDPTGPPG